jgi:RHS repeat-associated protein
VQSYRYDAAGRLVTHTDRAGATKVYGYDSHNLVTSVTATRADGSVQSQSYRYDAVGNLERATDGGVTSNYNVMALGTDPVPQYRSDPYGLVHRVQESVLGATQGVSYDWDAYQRLASLTAGTSPALVYTYDGLDRIVSLSGVTTAAGFRYEPDTGRLEGVPLANGIEVRYGYDRNDRPTGIEYARGAEVLKTIDLGYDGNSNVTSKNDNHYRYDERNMLAEATLHDRFAADIRKPQAAGIAERDVAGQGDLELAEVESTYALDVNANSVGVDLGQEREVYGIVVSPASGGNRLDKENVEVWLKSAGAARWSELSREDFIVLKDDEGAMDIRFRVPERARYAKLHQLYDERNVGNEDVGSPTVSNGSSVLLKLRYFIADRVERYEYDAAGKRQGLGVTFDGQSQPGVSYSYYEGTELLKTDGRWGYGYDANGNLVEKGESWTDHGTEITVEHPADSAAWRYGWDAFNRLTGVESWQDGNYQTVASYTYNHRGLRVGRTSATSERTRYLYDQDGNVVLTTYADGSSEQQVWLGGKLVQRIVRNAAGAELARRYLLTDHLGTVVMVTDEEGKIVSEGNVTPFGQDAGPSGFEDLAMRYTGKDVDPDTGLVYVNARWLDTATGRFLSEDLVLDGTLWYAYVANNPMSYVDPTGLDSTDFYEALTKASASEQAALSSSYDEIVQETDPGNVNEIIQETLESASSTSSGTSSSSGSPTGKRDDKTTASSSRTELDRKLSEGDLTADKELMRRNELAKLRAEGVPEEWMQRIEGLSYDELTEFLTTRDARMWAAVTLEFQASAGVLAGSGWVTGMGVSAVLFVSGGSVYPRLYTATTQAAAGFTFGPAVSATLGVTLKAFQSSAGISQVERDFEGTAHEASLAVPIPGTPLAGVVGSVVTDPDALGNSWLGVYGGLGSPTVALGVTDWHYRMVVHE